MSKIVSVQTLQQEKVSRGTQLGQLLLPWLFPFGLIVLWQIASSTGLLESRIYLHQRRWLLPSGTCC